MLTNTPLPGHLGGQIALAFANLPPNRASGWSIFLGKRFDFEPGGFTWPTSHIFDLVFPRLNRGSGLAIFRLETFILNENRHSDFEILTPLLVYFGGLDRNLGGRGTLGCSCDGIPSVQAFKVRGGCGGGASRVLAHAGRARNELRRGSRWGRRPRRQWRSAERFMLTPAFCPRERPRLVSACFSRFGASFSVQQIRHSSQPDSLPSTFTSIEQPTSE